MPDPRDCSAETHPPGFFDRWAARYDADVHAARDRDAYPFAGYDAVLDTVVDQAAVRAGHRVLDLGTGTGALAERCAARGADVWGLDASPAMLERARDRVPRLTTAVGDVMGPLPTAWPTRFDAIVSTYVFHHVPLDAKVARLHALARDHLTPGGRLVVADVAWPTAAERSAARTQLGDRWDDAEWYWATDETIAAFAEAGCTVTATQVSWCAACYAITPDPAP